MISELDKYSGHGSIYYKQKAWRALPSKATLNSYSPHLAQLSRIRSHYIPMHPRALSTLSSFNRIRQIMAPSRAVTLELANRRSPEQAFTIWGGEEERSFAWLSSGLNKDQA